MAGRYISIANGDIASIEANKGKRSLRETCSVLLLGEIVMMLLINLNCGKALNDLS
jgi:hypothetical protein|tara:strand:- start:270 stop:437 length:168 start_codon:yes stop_codon:yes gene_type:complete